MADTSGDAQRKKIKQGEEDFSEKVSHLEEQKEVGINVILAAGGLVWRDSPRGKELVVIHRVRYGDWTLPKGKVVVGERLQDTALREVREETGCEVRLGTFSGCVGYIVNNVPKVVLYWNMITEGECAFKPDEEVDQLVWLSPREALSKLDYDNERDLLQKYFQLKETTRFKRLFWSLSQKRLVETIGPYRRELEYLIEKCEKKHKGSTTLWAKATRDLLTKAQEALDKGETELGYQYLNSSQLMSLYGLENEELKIKARAIWREAEKKLTSWRMETVTDLLVDKLTVKDKLTVEEVQYANRILQEQFTNTYNKLRTFKWQLGWLALTAFLAIIPSLLLVPSLFEMEFQLNNPNLVPLVALFGIMGASLSGILSIAKSIEAGIPITIFTSWITLTRPLIGAVAALAIFVFLMSGLLQLGELTPSLILAVSFAAGISERLVMGVVDKIK